MALRQRQPLSKAARNEQRKLIATAFNNVGVAFALAGLLQPALAYLQQHRSFDVASAVATSIFVLIAALAFLTARAIIAKLED